MQSTEVTVEEPKKSYNSKKRFAILIYPEVQQGMLKLAKQYKVSQSIIAKTLYNMADLERLGELLSLKFAGKIEAKNSKKEIIKRLSGMSNE